MTVTAQPVVIGLYGGVGAGKDRVAEAFAALGAEVLDADIAVADLYAEPSVRDAVAARFGEAILTADGVDRPALAKIVFADADARRDLEAILHPPIHRRFQQRVEDATRAGTPGVLVLNVPLLLESPSECLVTVGVFVDAPLEVREARVTQNRGWKPGEVARRDATQPPLDQKRARCAHVIDNSQTPAATEAQVRALWESLVQRGHPRADKSS